MKKLIVRTLPATFMFVVMCCGHGISSNFRTADYTKYKADQAKKIELRKSKS